jgi:hypothetical protein
MFLMCSMCSSVHDQVAEITERAMNGEMDFDESLRERCRALKVLGIPAANSTAHSAAHSSILPPVLLPVLLPTAHTYYYHYSFYCPFRSPIYFPFYYDNLA